MSFAAQLAAPDALHLDWYTRHPALDQVTLHVEGLDAETVAVASLPANVQTLLAQLDAALASHVAAQAGIPCTAARPEPDAEPLDSEPLDA